MKLWLISQTEKNDDDTYDSAVVAAYTGDDARAIHPANNEYWGRTFDSWCSAPDKVIVRLIGDAGADVAVGEVLCASFNAG